MLDFRYHVFSIAAVFLALGLGVLIGSSFGNSAITGQQNRLLQNSIKKLDRVLQERTEDQTLLRQNREALSVLVPRLTHDLLAGRHVAIVRAGDDPLAAQDAQQAIEQAGGNVTSVTVLTGRFSLLSDKERAALSAKLSAAMPPTAGSPPAPPRTQDTPTTGQDNTTFLLPLAQALTQGTQAKPSLQGGLDELNSAQLISRSGDYSIGCDLIVVVGGSSDSQPTPGQDSASLEHQFIGAVQAGGNGARVVGCEAETAAASSVPAYQAAGIASIDCIDEPLGALDLIYALQGEAASYGVKPTADHLVPASLEKPVAAAS